MRTYIDRLVPGFNRAARDRRVRLVPRSGRPRRARTTFVALDPRTALAY